MQKLWKTSWICQFSHWYHGPKASDWLQCVPPILAHFYFHLWDQIQPSFSKCAIACGNWVPWACFGQKIEKYWKLDCGDVCHQSSATLSRWRQSPRSPPAPSHLTPHLYWNLNDTICALPRRKVWIRHFEFTFGIWKWWWWWWGWRINIEVLTTQFGSERLHPDVKTTKPR